MRVRVEVEEIELMGGYDGDQPIASVCVTCTKCGESVEVYGTSGQSVRRGCIMLREGCDGLNYYFCDDYED